MVDFVTPDRSLQQRREAIRKANDVRAKRAVLKRELQAGSGEAARLLASPPEWLSTMKVHDLLLAQRKWGRVKASRALWSAQVSPSKTVGGLSPRQRNALLAGLGVEVRRAA